MVDSIKITALQDIGANIAYTTLVPVVNMAGTPTTQKSNLQNMGNLILNGAGGSYFAPAARAILAQSVTNAAQPNITSVGTLTSLVVTGNIRAGNANLGNIATANFYYGDGGFLTNVASNGSYSNSNVANYLPTFTGNVGAGNVNATGTVYASGISSTGLASLTILNVSTTANLGAVGNVRITGGTSGQKLTTDGAGNLTWTNDANSSYGNSNVAAYLPTYTGNVGASNVRSAGNLGVTANTLTWNFTNQGVLEWPGGIGQIDTNNSTFEIHSTNGLMISTNEANSSQSFLFDTAGVFTAPGNVNLLGSRLNVGPTAANVANLLNPTLVIANSGADYIQAAIINGNANGSSDWSADGAGGGDDEAWTDMGFAGFSFNDANFTITEPGDGYLFVQAYANGLGGNMVLATGDHSNTADIIFATGGFLANNEFARIDHANDVFHLTRANSGIRFADGTTQTTAATGGNIGAELVNGNNSFVLDNDGNVVFEGTPAGNAINRGLVWDFGANANGVNSTIRQDNGGLILRAWTENAGNYAASVNIVTNQDANTKTWLFNGSGNLILPGSLIVPEGNIVSRTIGPAFNSAITGITTGNATVIVTIADEVFEGPFNGTVTISNVTGTTEANGTWGYEATSLDTFQLYTDNTLSTPVDGTTWTTYVSGGNAVSTGTSYTDLIVQGGNVSIGSNDSIWEFGADGSLILAGGSSVIQSIANSSLDPVNPNVSTMTFTPDANYSSQSLVLDPTAPGHIHLRAFSPSNIDAPAANIFLGGEDTSFEVTQGANNQAVIHSGGNTWTFGNTGILTLPGEGVIQSFDDTIVLQSVDTGTGNSSSVRLATDGSLYFEGTEYLNGWFQIANDSGDANIVSPSGNISITPAFGVANAAGKSLTLQGGAADQSDFYTGTGGAVNITGGLGSSDDGGGGGPGGNVNITSGNSSDPAGHAGNINITAGNYDWVFDYNGDLTLPGNLVYIGASPAPSIRGFSSVSALQFTNGNSNVTINANSNTWNFDSTGNLTIPSTSGGFIKTASNASIGIAAVDNGTNNPAQLLSLNAGTGAATSIVSAYATNATIQTNAAGTINTWTFGNTGNLTLPANTFAINYANGTQVSLGGSNIANGNSSVSIATAAGNVVANVNGSTVFTAYSGGIKVGGSGILQSPGGAGAITLNNNGANIPTANITTQLNVTGASGANITANLTAGNISTGGTLTSTGKFGYASGSTVTQTTSRGNGVTINTLAGTIITTSAAMAVNEIDTFSVINSSVDPNSDIVLAQIVSPNQGTYNCIANPALIGGFSNGFYINIVNISGFTTSDETITVRFMVIKAPNA